MRSDRHALPASGLLLLIAAGLVLAPLARFWNKNPDYSFGWGVPLLAAYLAYERWRTRPSPAHRSGARRALALLFCILAGWAFLLLAARMFIETEPASRPLLWLTASLLAGALLAWIGLLGGRPWLRHFAFPVVFLLVGVPWLFGCEFTVEQNLMRANAAAVAGALTLADVPASAAGNTIVLATGQLGVNEACSGMRSLQAALMMSLFFGEFYRYGGRGRISLVAAGVALALAGNFGRMLLLAWRGAADGVGAVEADHDTMGWSILVFDLVALWLICACTRPVRAAQRSNAHAPSRPALRVALSWAIGVCAAALLAEALTQGWYGWRERSAPHYPTWTVTWPAGAPDFQSSPVPDAIRERLRATTANAATWRDAAGRRWNGLWIRYGGDAEGKVVFESHNPGLCLPAAGWSCAAAGRSFPLQVGPVRLEVESSTFTVGDSTAHVFWIPYLDGGVRAGADRTPGLYGHTFAALIHGQLPWLDDAWAGCRGVQAETLELALLGPARETDVQEAFDRLVPALIQPDKPPTLAAATR